MPPHLPSLGLSNVDARPDPPVQSEVRRLTILQHGERQRSRPSQPTRALRVRGFSLRHAPALAAILAMSGSTRPCAEARLQSDSYSSTIQSSRSLLSNAQAAMAKGNLGDAAATAGRAIDELLGDPHAGPTSDLEGLLLDLGRVPKRPGRCRQRGRPASSSWNRGRNGCRRTTSLFNALGAAWL